MVAKSVVRGGPCISEVELHYGQVLLVYELTAVRGGEAGVTVTGVRPSSTALFCQTTVTLVRAWSRPAPVVHGLECPAHPPRIVLVCGIRW